MEEFRAGHRSGVTPPSRVARPPASSGTKPPTVTPDVTESMADQINQLRAEIARLRAGADDHPGDENAVPTPGQWIARFLARDADQRVRAVEHIERQAEDAGRCFILDHEGRLEDQQERLRTLHALLAEILSGSVWSQTGHPGEPSVRTGWIRRQRLHDWRVKAGITTGDESH